jgi:hypothetical protein
MSRINRQTIVRGPAAILFNGATFFSRGDITLDWNLANETVESSAYGPVFDYRTGVSPSLSLELVGEIEDLDVLFPYATTVPGSSIFGSADTPLEICPLDTDQEKIVFAAAAVAKMPDLSLGVSGGVALGAMEFAFAPKNGSLPTDNDAWYTTAANDYDGTGFDPSKIAIESFDGSWISDGTFTLSWGGDTTAALDHDSTAGEVQTALNALASITAAGGVTVSGSLAEGWTVTWDDPADRAAITGSASGMPGGTAVAVTTVTAGTVSVAEVQRIELGPWHSFPCREAAKVTFDLQLTDDRADSIGAFDKVFRGVSAKATLLPLNVTDTALLAATKVQGSGAALGANAATGTHDLTLSSTSLAVTLHGARITKSGLVWGSENQRVPEIEWTTSRTVSGGVLQPLFTIAAL